MLEAGGTHGPAETWTVEGLASEAGMSRTAFAEQFVRTVNCTPLAYVTEWRLTKAHALVTDTRRSLDDIALEVGYGSAAALSRAFSRRFDIAPSGLR